MASAIEDIIEEIEEYLDTCKPSGFSGSFIKVNRDDLDSFLDELKAKTPEEIRRYQQIISNREAILADAQRKADEIIKEAEVEKTDLVSEHEIMQQAYAQANEVVMIATKQAQEILDTATAQSNDIRTSAITYTDNLLKNVQEIIVNSMDTTRSRTDNFLNTMQEYLDTVVENRMELNPSAAPAQQTAKEPAQQQGQGLGGQPAKTPAPESEESPSNSAKDSASQQTGGLNVPDEKFFNKS